MTEAKHLPDITLAKIGCKKKGTKTNEGLWEDLNQFLEGKATFSRNDIFVVAKCHASQALIGVATLSYTKNEVSDSISVDYIEIHKDYRCQGIATLMLSIFTGPGLDGILDDITKPKFLRPCQPNFMYLVMPPNVKLNTGNSTQGKAVSIRMHIPFEIGTFKLAKKMGCVPVGLCEVTGPECAPKIVMMRMIKGEVSDGPKITTRCRETLDQLVGFCSCSPFCNLPARLISGICSLASETLEANRDENMPVPVSPSTLEFFFDSFDIERLARYIMFGGHKLSSVSLAGDLWPLLAFLYFRGHFQSLPSQDDMPRIEKVSLAPYQRAVLAGLGFQRKTADQLAADLQLNKEQLEVQFKLCLRTFHVYLTSLLSRRAAAEQHNSTSTTSGEQKEPQPQLSV